MGMADPVDPNAAPDSNLDDEAFDKALAGAFEDVFAREQIIPHSAHGIEVASPVDF